MKKINLKKLKVKTFILRSRRPLAELNVTSLATCTISVPVHRATSGIVNVIVSKVH